MWGFFFCFGLRKQIVYTASGILKKGSSTEGSSLFKTLDFMSGRDSSSSEENPIDLLNTYGVVSKVVKKLHLQGCIVEKKSGNRLRNLWNNLILERKLSHLRSSERPFSEVLTGDVLVPKSPIILNTPCPIVFEDLFYEQEFYTILSLHFINDETFTVNDSKGKKIGEGSINAPFYFLTGQFTLTKKSEASLKGKNFSLSFIPLSSAAKGLENKITVKKDKLKPSFINIFYSSTDRHMAAAVVNQLMESYQLFVMEKAREKISKQMSYLSLRKKDTIDELEKVIEEHKNYLKENIGQGGFLVLNNEAAFMMEKQATLLARQGDIKYNIQRIASLLFGEIPSDFDELLKIIEEIKEENTADQEFVQPLTLDVGEKLFSSYMEELDGYELERKHYLFCSEKLNDPDVNVVSLINTFSEPLLQAILKDIQSLYSNFLDAKNWTEKEKVFFKEQLNNKKEILKKELLQLAEGRNLQRTVLHNKLAELQKSFLIMLFDELEKNKNVLRDIAKKETAFPDKWFKEKRIDLNTQMAMSFVEQITKAIEGKNLSYHLTAVDSYPIEYAISPILPHSPRLFFRANFMAVCGLFFYLSFLLMRYLYQGPTSSYKNLKSTNFDVFGELPLSLASTFEKLDRETRLSLKNLSFSLIKKRKEKNVILLTSQHPLFFTFQFLELFRERNERFIILDLNESEKEGLCGYLKGTSETIPIKKLQKIDFVPFGTETVFKEELLSSEKFVKTLNQLKSSYDWIFICNTASPKCLETQILTSISDFVVCLATKERLYELWNLPEETLYLTLKIEKPKEWEKMVSYLKVEKEIYLNEAAPLIDALQAKINKRESLPTTKWKLRISKFLERSFSRWQEK